MDLTDLLSRNSANSMIELEALSPSIGAPFVARRLRSIDVVWINERWFLGRGVDVIDGGTRAAVVEALKAEFGFAVPRPPCDLEPEEFYEDFSRVLYADRYGAPGGTPNHGGSGRCGYAGALNAKGIGPTPLIGETADWYHSHGCMWLEEAIRETILAEVASAEFPHGAVPTVAILRINDVLRRPDGSFEPPRAIMIRPNFIRPAHFERSIYFGRGGLPNSQQFIDAERVREAVSSFCKNAGDKGALGVSTASVQETLTRISRQIGHGWFHRLYHGGVFSSNVTVDGELVDFGSFRALPDWRRARTTRAAPPFGEELAYMLPMIDSLAFYFRKYGTEWHHLPETRSLMRDLLAIAQSSFEESCEKAFNLAILGTKSASKPRIIAEAWLRFRQAQSSLVDYIDGGGPVGCATELNSSKERPVKWVSSMLATLGPDLGQDAAIIGAAAARWASQRRLIYRETLVRLTNRIVGASNQEHNDGIGRFIRACTSKSRRQWSSIPPNLILVGQHVGSHSSVLYCVDPQTSDEHLIVEATLCGTNVVIFGQRVPAEALGTECCKDPNLSRAVVPVMYAGLNPRKGGVVRVGGIAIALPPADKFYVRGTSSRCES
ncbi:hypothetical protein P3W33_17505 [Luteibacter sp. PPL552]